MSRARATGRLGLAALAYGLAVVVVLADQGLKFWVLQGLRLTEVAPAHVAGPLWFSLVWNRGFSFGLLNVDSDVSRWVLVAFRIAVTLALGVWAWRLERRTLAFAVGLIMGGAVGNVIDQLRLGAVTDFIDLTRLWFPWVFNLADSAITLGSALLIWDLFLAPRNRPAA
ncbi:MAG: signal peptidase II [Caulobacteraceae bacterium]